MAISRVERANRVLMKTSGGYRSFFPTAPARNYMMSTAGNTWISSAALPYTPWAIPTPPWSQP